MREQAEQARKDERLAAFSRVTQACRQKPTTEATLALAKALVEFRAVLQAHGRLERAVMRTAAFGRPSAEASHGWNYATALVASIFDGRLATTEDLHAALDKLAADVEQHELMCDLGSDRVLDMLSQALSLPLAGTTLEATDEEIESQARRDEELRTTNRRPQPEAATAPEPRTPTSGSPDRAIKLSHLATLVQQEVKTVRNALPRKNRPQPIAGDLYDYEQLRAAAIAARPSWQAHLPEEFGEAVNVLNARTQLS